MSEVKLKIENLLDQNKVVLFMKGTQQFPQCGFSARATAILQDLGVSFKDVNVLEDEEIRNGIKEYGNWPTIPQLYINKKLVGGSDIMMEMYQAGELQELLKN
ncbi:MAG: monothiol glutaredoxin, Grx4 family [Bdellovibrionales bacterium RIFCSPHIGHO2_01_FULL_40_29]|nr:MAG: monothiol glutaredoxin, Grx4 family [Bdellovibrionales bacterium RIFCSPHIGHO2_01_FULL_40_29]OFZ33848.1 MAG: monothiol glutaredoxin, Grx4 family [Bdellovibrionales bacterium RIFCSPHIGHO2_02_FULL_40_15]